MTRADALQQLAAADALTRRQAQVVAEAVAWARREGATWSEIGTVLGVTRQGATRKYGRGDA